MCLCVMSHSDDIILPEAQLIVVMALKIQQSLCSSPSVSGHDQEVFMVPLVALHGVVRGELLQVENKWPKHFIQNMTFHFPS